MTQKSDQMENININPIDVFFWGIYAEGKGIFKENQRY